MKKDIHPKYEKANVECSCGNKFETRSTMAKIHIEICSACHPFFTGTQKLVDTAGRVDKFKAKLKKAEEHKKKRQVTNNKQYRTKEKKSQTTTDQSKTEKIKKRKQKKEKRTNKKKIGAVAKKEAKATKK